MPLADAIWEVRNSLQPYRFTVSRGKRKFIGDWIDSASISLTVEELLADDWSVEVSG